MRGVKFHLWGEVAHFLQASFSIYWATYPIPPRTVLMGLIGAILGLDKDTPQIELADAQFSVSGAIPTIHVHCANLRKNPIPSKRSIPSFQAAFKAEGETTRFTVHTTRVQQEWLYKPDYTIIACLPDKYHDEVVRRVRDNEYYYTPCLGKTGMFAMFDLIEEGEIEPLPEGDYSVHSVVRQTPSTKLQLTDYMAMRTLIMPWSVDTERVFTPCPDPYLIPYEGDPVPVHTADAQCFRGPTGDQAIMFL